MTSTIINGQAFTAYQHITHDDAPGSVQVEVFVQLKVNGIAIAVGLDVFLIIGHPNVDSITWFHLAGFVAIGLQIPAFASRGLHCSQLVDVHCIFAWSDFGNGFATCINTRNGNAWTVDNA